MSKVTFPGTGHAYSDDGSTDRDMLNGGHAEWLLPMLGETVDTAQSAVDAATSAAQSKADAGVSAASAQQDAGTASTARSDAQAAAQQAKNWAATVNIAPLVGKGGLALFAKPDESGGEWRRAVRCGGGAQQGDNQVYIGWDGQRLRVQVDVTDLGRIVLDSNLQAAQTALQAGIDSKADANATANSLNQKANQSDLNNTNTAVATKASQDALNVTNNNVNGKAQAGARVQWDSGLVEFGPAFVGAAVDCDAPYVVVGLRTTNDGNGIANRYFLRAVVLRNS
jgi:hypothetical protein